MKIVWVNGCFDILHRGHLELFKFAKSQGDFLVVGIDSDLRVKNSKGESRPFNNENDRKFFLECIKFVDKVVVFEDDDELRTLISIHKPDCMIIGSDWRGKRIVGGDLAKSIMFFNRFGDYSTTKILETK